MLPCRISSKGWKVRRALLARPSSLSLAPAPPPAIAAQSHDEALSDAISLLAGATRRDCPIQFTARAPRAAPNLESETGRGFEG